MSNRQRVLVELEGSVRYSHRSFCGMIEVSKKDIEKIIAEIDKRKKIAVINTEELNKRANEVLNNKG